MPLSNYSQVFNNAEYSPTQDLFGYEQPFEKTYLTDAYTMSPNDSLSTFFDTESFFDQAATTLEKKSSNSSSRPQSFNPILPLTSNSTVGNQYDGTVYPEITSVQMEGYAPWPSFDSAAVNLAAINPAGSASFSPTVRSSSRTPSLCGDGQQPGSPSMSPRLIKRESPFSPVSQEEQTTPKRPLRKRGRPRLDQLDTESQSAGPSSAKCQRSSRLPHNQVERKYREGLNSELERLRKAVPTLSKSEEALIKPSKGMILSSAIDYIKSIERERDALREEGGAAQAEPTAIHELGRRRKLYR
ncbi:hypothetical protein SNOG_07556 [Parastagonospora nodorum SN15]|uniref:BHLH domain-containing protein n=1 Tax=Phaeosphaeria nodorum (strain SN15 / ATCC MYA-4574 / FGSC 10173) TaxID=321614 RepID=Q0UL08_PHANO|nr:hypothetical protein SNOG_07556 [Parastagonospora nodorum SN15]EAT85022.1 hypothetical protein SNOG_07556 [Parastagonospora nodorum SN15]